MKKATYVVDSSSLIQAWEVYPENQFGDLWAQLEALIEQGRMRAPEDVRLELAAGADPLTKWAKAHKDLFYPTDERLLREMREVSKLPGFVVTTGRKNMADPWVVALARVRESVVITEEKGKGTGPGVVKIPDACKHFNLQHSRIQGLFARENWIFKITK